MNISVILQKNSVRMNMKHPCLTFFRYFHSEGAEGVGSQKMLKR